MAFTVEDFQDLLRLLDQHPEWQVELRRRVLTEELLDVPSLLRRLIEAQARTDEHIATLAAAQARTEERLDALIARLDALTSRVDANTGELLELRYERRAGAYFSTLARSLRMLDRSTLADLLDDEVDRGRISEAERRDVLRADLVLTGQRREDRADVYIVVEVSSGIGSDDVRRAADSASVMSKLGRPAIPVVAGERIDPEPAALAKVHGVWQVLNGRASSPGEAAS